MVNQGFFSFRDNFGEQMSDRFAGEKENTIAQVAGPSTPIGSEYGLGSLNINRGATFPVNIRPKKGFTLDDVYGIKKVEADFVSPRGNEVGQIASSDLTNLRVGSPEVRLASVKSYIPDVTRPYAPDDVGDYIKESETEKRPTYGENLEKAIDNLESFDMRRVDKVIGEEYGVPMSKEEKRATTAYTLTNPDVFGGYYRWPKTNYDKIQSDYDKYQHLRDRRVFRKGVEDNLSDWRSDYMNDFADADYAIKMKQYNLDGTEKDINRYNQTLDQQIDNLDRLDEPNYSLDRFGNVLHRSEVEAYNKKVDSEEAERIRLSKLQARKNYEDSQKNILQRVENFLGDAFNTITGTQEARGDVLDGRINFNNSVPNISTFSETGDPSFRSYRMGQDFADSIRGIGNLPSDYKATEEAAFRAAEKFRDTVSAMSNLPSDYKSTEAAAFKKAQNFRKQVAEDKKIQGIIDRNPRLTRGADGSVKAVQKTRAEAGASARTAAGNRARVKANAKARAKAAAVNRRKKKNKKN